MHTDFFFPSFSLGAFATKSLKSEPFSFTMSVSLSIYPYVTNQEC